MPRPVKPPMTLKEAKRAHKKDDTGFRYTASQMARADRQDAQEEKRRKALDKERTKKDNKRKREEKADRDRAVKQKMLDEGRITIEDTWGKVAASQPRLNKFFAQPRTKHPPPSRLSRNTAVNSGDDAPDGIWDGLQSETEDDADSRERVEMTEEIGAQQDIGAPDALPALEPPSQAVSITKSLDARQSLNHPRQRPRLSSPLQEQRSSQINSRAGRFPHASPTSANYPKVLEPQKSLTTVNKSTTLQNHLHTSLPSIKVTKSINSTPTKRNDGTKHLPRAGRHSLIPAAPQYHKGLETVGHKSAIAENNRRVEEDFTDGIDDNEFLLLCDGQTTAPNENAVSISPFKDTNTEILPSTPSNGHTTSTIELSHPGFAVKDKPKHTTPLSDDLTTEPVPSVLNESFSAVFNEIDDSEMIAFAEQVEAEMVASGQSCSTTMKQVPKPPLAASSNQPFQEKTSKGSTASKNKNSHTFLKDTKVTPMKRPLPQNVQEPRRQTKVANPSTNNQSATPIVATKPNSTAASKAEPSKPLQVKTKRRRAMPWDDIEGPGPSTQAVILELLEEAEAKMKR
ncbi:hypothetical protein LTR84_011589 [Exophiala bonariae]|uniref:Uncharacterized protein n=1 Tax=Exophiala bonariae TaxID=1690606 RepID=A0AAV9NKV4_9EURO|nr:hypothetical protein LTR84_011589 [Exophiala bonariae]